MPKDYIGQRTGKIIMPGDPGFTNPRLPWGSVRNVSGWKKADAVRLPIAGFFLIDRRLDPPAAIFKNMVVPGNVRKLVGEQPLPFNSLDEALYHKEKMHLSIDDAPRVKPVALSPDPGMGNPMPNVMWMDKKTAKNM